jgi:hypothetical protein
LRQAPLDHVPVVSMIVLRRRFEQHDHTLGLLLLSANLLHGGRELGVRRGSARCL